MQAPYSKLIERIRDVKRLGSIVALLDWDQETYMPQRGVTARADQIALASGLAHETLVNPEVKSLLDSATAPAGDFVAETNLREIRRAYRRAANVPTSLVKEIAKASTLAKDAWSAARKQSDFSAFAPHLTRLVELKRQTAECIGYEVEAYDALIDEFEPGLTASRIEPLFRELREATVSLLRRIQSAPKKPDGSILFRHYPKEQQASLSRQVAESLGYDFSAGRSDVSVHPFCTTIGGPGDVRITTRYLEDQFTPAFFGTVHETGHALYEQGLLAEHMFTPMGEAVSLGIHESQSRLWENQIGRSRPFWEYHWPIVKKFFPAALGNETLDRFHAAINHVTPSLIRVEADELTYNLHIILRFEMERALFTGSLVVKDVPAVWNTRMKEFLDTVPGCDREGCLQDIHWSMGSFGYFPTYTLGNLNAAQLYARARQDLPRLDEHVQSNDHKPLLSWLRENVHRHGQRFRASELIERVTGAPLSIQPFITYVTQKFSPIYGL